jgi:hypothetical protein
MVILGTETEDEGVFFHICNQYLEAGTGTIKLGGYVRKDTEHQVNLAGWALSSVYKFGIRFLKVALQVSAHRSPLALRPVCSV